MSQREIPVCAKCAKRTCVNFGPPDRAVDVENAPEFCPMKLDKDLVELALREYEKPDIKQFSLKASQQEAQCYERIDGEMRTKIPRIEETIQFAKKMGYKKLGLVFCIGLAGEALTFNKMLENNDFEVTSVCCKAGGASTEKIGMKPEETVFGPSIYSSMCNPIVQALTMNRQQPEWVVMMGLCVGHDTLFLKYCDRPVTVLAVKDRVLAHNPLAGIYLSSSIYYKRLMGKIR